MIKSHHNVGGLPEDIAFKGLIEPLRILFKDEVRLLGESLNMPAPLVWRQPFPGPGLAIRILGDITDEKLDILRKSDFILRDEIAKAGLDRSKFGNISRYLREYAQSVLWAISAPMTTQSAFAR